MLPLKILPKSAMLLTLGLLAAAISGQQQRRVIGFDAEGRITIQVQFQLQWFISTCVNFAATHLYSLTRLFCFVLFTTMGYDPKTLLEFE